MISHYTPTEVAKVLLRHAPRKVSAILEPAVGTGILLEPLLTNAQRSIERIVCIDTDVNALKAVTIRFRNHIPKVTTECADFLLWSKPAMSVASDETFDCILMNPPFAARREHYIKLDLSDELPGLSTAIRYAPIEVAFVLRSIRLLRPGGRLLAVLPASIISSSRMIWVREYLLRLGSIRYVHELPPFTFKTVEARVYLFVFEKSTKRNQLVLCNHDLVKPVTMKTVNTALTPELRLDYRFHSGLREYQELMSRSGKLEWKTVSELADVHRGGGSHLRGRGRLCTLAIIRRAFGNLQAEGPNA